MRFILVFLLTGLLTTLYADDPKTISGKITDAETGRPILDATIYIPELKINTISNLQGEFYIKDVPSRGKYIIEISFLGYQTLIQIIDFSQATNLQYALKKGTHQMQEVIITGTAISSTNKKNSTSSTALGKADLMVPSTNVIDAIARQAPGVSAITTGPSISKPVIRGLSSNRVVTIGNGIKQQGNQWGDEHGIEIDQYDVDRVEVLRGSRFADVRFRRPRWGDQYVGAFITFRRIDQRRDINELFYQFRTYSQLVDAFRKSLGIGMAR